MKLSAAIEVKARFSRSVNLERDTSIRALEGYVPTGRALDVVRRLAQGILDAPSGRAFSITGPHGGGKSSLAIYIDALTAPKNSAPYRNAMALLKDFDSNLASLWVQGSSKLPNAQGGFVRALATATREPISFSLIRALDRALGRDLKSRKDFSARLSKIRRMTEDRDHLFLDLVKDIAAQQPLIFVIDEFGKNLESYADSPADADPYILQALAELGQGEKALPIFVMTMQHLSFDDYVQGTSGSQRREWAKIQGRFQDIPYVDSPSQSRKLIASVFESKNKAISSRYAAWLKTHSKVLTLAGLGEIAQNPDTVNSYPLHPLTLSVLPQLCSRYGQNERTLFSFLASRESSSVATFLSNTDIDGSGKLSFVGLDRVYDYFLESAPTMLSASNTANRWIEIESRIRDVHGLNQEEKKILKTIGLLNLVTSGGSLRASKEILLLSLSVTNENPAATRYRLNSSLAKLEERGLVIYRAFADEYRVWQGSDFDLRAATENARRAQKNRSLASVLNEVVGLEPIVAGRHSQLKGVLRVFDQKFFDPLTETLESPNGASHFDGIVGYATSHVALKDLKPLADGSKPVVILSPKDVGTLSELALETSALHCVLNDSGLKTLDWVARRELVERYVSVKQRMLEIVNETWFEDSDWYAGKQIFAKLDKNRGISSALSDVCDEVYFRTPRVASEMIARRELTSQGARARRVLIEAMLTSVNKPIFGLEGFGPDRAIYEAIFRSTGLHAKNSDGQWELRTPRNVEWKLVWQEIQKSIDSATSSRLPIPELSIRLTQPPYGLKEGVIPLLVLAAVIARGSDLAIYEHGTLVLNLDDAVAERFAKNPDNFALRNYATSSGPRFEYVKGIVKAFKIENVPTENTFLAVARALYRELHFLTPFSKGTTDFISEKTILVRDVFNSALEPDILFFNDLPRIFGFRPISSKSSPTSREIDEFANSLLDAFKDMRSSYPRLLEKIGKIVAEATMTSSDVFKMRQQLVGQATNLEGRVLEKNLKSFIGAIERNALSDEEWLANLAMVIADGSPARSWNDESFDKFAHRAAEVGGSLRRLQALLYDRLSKGEDTFEAVRLTVTHPDGSEDVQILSISEQEKTQVSKILEPLLNNLEDRFGSTSAAKAALLAFLTYSGIDSAELSDVEKSREKRVNE